MKVVLATCLWISAAVFPAQADFVNVTPANLDVGGWAAAWGDYDNDGDCDLFVTHADTDMLFRNDGDLVFEDVADLPLADSIEGRGASWADYDNDGDNDLFVTNYYPYSSPGPLRNLLARNDGNDIFEDVTGQSGTDSLATPTMGGSAWGDFDNDGDLDLYVVDSTFDVPNRMFRNDGDDQFELVDAGDASLTGESMFPAAADFDNDGDLDIYLPMYDGANRLLRNEGPFDFTDVADQVGVDDTGASWVADWGDYDNDQDLDLFVISTPHKLFRNDEGSFVDVTDAADIVSESLPGSGSWLDFNNDGLLDLLVANYGGDNRLYRNNGTGMFTDVAAGLLQSAYRMFGLALADFDRDGDLDLFFGEGTTNLRHNYLLAYQAASAHHWLHVHLIGDPGLPPPFSNSSAVGARVRIVADVDGTPPAESQIREIAATASLSGNTSLLVEFGLGVATAIDTIEVTWPSGRIDVCASPSLLDRPLTWREGEPCPTAGIETLPQPMGALRLHQNRPNPFNPSTTIAFELPHPSLVTLRIYDIAGRHVRTLVDGTMESYFHNVAWDGLDESGRRLGSGVYFYRIDADDWSESRSMVLVR